MLALLPAAPSVRTARLCGRLLIRRNRLPLATGARNRATDDYSPLWHTRVSVEEKLFGTSVRPKPPGAVGALARTAKRTFITVSLVLVLASLVCPGLVSMLIVAIASFIAGLAFSSAGLQGSVRRDGGSGEDAVAAQHSTPNQIPDAPSVTATNLQTRELEGLVEDLRMQVEALQKNVEFMALTGYSREDNRLVSASGDSVQRYVPAREESTEVRLGPAAVEHPGSASNLQDGMEDPRYSSRMRERILFLWGETGLRWFGLEPDIYQQQLARSADQHAFISRNKWFLESIYNVDALHRADAPPDDSSASDQEQP